MLTAPDGTVYKELYEGTAAWQKGLVTENQTWSGGVKQKWTTTAYTQDDTNLSYQKNPRVIETNVYDSASPSNRRRTTIDYGQYAQWGLPYVVREYDADALTEIRQTYTDYLLTQPYLDRRIIGLVSAVHVTGMSAWFTKVTYNYDNTAVQAQATTATGHDQTYDANYLVRGNLTAVTRWDVTDINNANKALTTSVLYDAAGSIVKTTDPAGHENSIDYNDSFSRDGLTMDAALSFTTFAYPTTLTDADGFSTTVRYRYDLGAQTRVQGPPPANQPNGAIQIFAYDDAARMERVTTYNNGAYTRYVYGSNYAQSFTTVNTVADESYSVQIFDGVGRVILSSGNHPGSTGGYWGQKTVFDQMGRAIKQSNPIEIDAQWNPAGDDDPNNTTNPGYGWVYTQQTYDWKGRPRVITNPSVTQNPSETTTRTASYEGCGCAGGEVVTLTDEVGRKQKIYSDVLGRQWKAEVLNWDETVYSTTTKAYNTRDQVTLVRQWAGVEGSGVYQDTIMSYDGYGRVKTKHAPEQQVDPINGTSTDHTTWEYNPDDTIHKITDARGASATYIYNNNRGLVNVISYSAPSGLELPIAATAGVGFNYDAAGNRISMTDSLGSVVYGYNQLSQMISETRTFNGVGQFPLSYNYNLAGELTAITDPWGGTVAYGFDSSGRLNNITGGGYGSVSQFASNMQYRAWNTLRSETFGNGFTEAATYNSRLQMTSFEVRKPSTELQMSTTNEFYPDGQVKVSHNALDERFDRAYAYDHGGRTTEAYTGSEARDFVNNTTSGTSTGPYRHSYQFNAFNQTTLQTGRLWNDTQPTGTSYTNNRVNGWLYDAAGFVQWADETVYRRDAAGRTVRAENGNSTGNYSFDGDGQLMTKLVTHPGPSGNTVAKLTYYLRSTVLGGLSVAELDSNAQKSRRYVYAARRKLAEEANGNVSWWHEEPVTGSRASSLNDGNYVPKAEFNADGVNVGFAAPQQTGFQMPEPVNDWPRPGLGSSGGSQCSGANPNCITCYVDYFEQNCRRLGQLADAGALAIEVRDRNGHTRQIPIEPLGGGMIGVWHDEQGRRLDPAKDEPGVVRVNHEEDGLGHWEWVTFNYEPQKPKGDKGSGPFGGKTTDKADPCAGVKADDLDYTTPRFRGYDKNGQPIYESGIDHITRRHILVDSGGFFLTPSRLPIVAQQGSKYVFQENVWTVKNAQGLVIAFNAWLFQNGKRETQRNGNIQITGVYPVTPKSDGGVFIGTGFDVKRGFGAPTNAGTLIVDKNCVGVVTSFPGLP